METAGAGIEHAIASSFRDPAAFVLQRDGVIQRAITLSGRDDYEFLMRSGLYQELTAEGLLIRHEERRPLRWTALHKVLLPEQLEFISYPYEWGFEQLKDAALLTLEVAERALRRRMMLKDASAFNIQFRGSRPVFIDTMSFTAATPGPWVAYEQFCRHFLAPLMLMAHVNAIANQHLKVNLEGFPLDVASRALPGRTWLQPGPLLHIHLHSKAIAHSSPARLQEPQHGSSVPALISSLRAAVTRLKPRRDWSEWLGYSRQDAPYTSDAMEAKMRMVEAGVAGAPPGLVYDLGANTGEYSRVAVRRGAHCIAFDSDPLCVDACYLQERESGSTSILPIVMDVCNPSAAAGFSLTERLSVFERATPTLVMALALTHHLRLSANVPFVRIADFFRKLSGFALVEFVGAEDPMVRSITERRRTPLPEDYSIERFILSFQRHFVLKQRFDIPGTHRTLCLFRGNP